MALGCGLTSVRGDRGKIRNESLVRQKHIKKKKLENRREINNIPKLSGESSFMLQYTSLRQTSNLKNSAYLKMKF
jgi:hypothetical protein